MECQNLCQQTEDCEVFTYILNSYNGQHGEAARRKCHLKNVKNGEQTEQEGLVSGPKFCPGHGKNFGFDFNFCPITPKNRRNGTSD